MKNQNTKKQANNFAFIDSQNLKRAITKAYIFIGYVKGNESLYTYLQDAGYILIFKPILQINGKIKGNVDAELVLHSMIQIKNYDKAVIVSGDGDFYCLSEYLLKNNKLLRIVTPSRKGLSSFYNKDFFRKIITHLDETKEKLGKNE